MDGAKEAIDLGVVQYARPGGYLPLVNAIAKVRGQLLSDPLSLSLSLSLSPSFSLFLSLSQMQTESLGILFIGEERKEMSRYQIYL